MQKYCKLHVEVLVTFYLYMLLGGCVVLFKSPHCAAMKFKMVDFFKCEVANIKHLSKIRTNYVILFKTPLFYLNIEF